jgi:hypothetical protein
MSVLTGEEEGCGILVELWRGASAPVAEEWTNGVGGSGGAVGVLEWKGKATCRRERMRVPVEALCRRREGKWRLGVAWRACQGRGGGSGGVELGGGGRPATKTRPRQLRAAHPASRGRNWALTGRPWLKKMKSIQNLKLIIQTDSKLICFKSDLSGLKKIKIKYGCEWFNVRNIFSYYKISIFRMDLNYKSGKILGVEFDQNLIEIS